MTTKILDFKKSDHFLHSQWDRTINDELLLKILPYVGCTFCEKDVVLVMPSFLKKNRVLKSDKMCLIIIIKQKLLVTAYWCDHPNYLFNNQDKVHYQLIY
ncbi:hypothetical protein [Flavobacterium sp.]|uniref:hypothetical protein n=1 Tax=Flavobacterium sp. TaxID=239 RepID=UPI0026256659|nr:hypothetical protein [Flavobacterium sp.]